MTRAEEEEKKRLAEPDSTDDSSPTRYACGLVGHHNHEATKVCDAEGHAYCPGCENGPRPVPERFWDGGRS